MYEIFANEGDCDSELKMYDCLEGCGGPGVSTESGLPECCDGNPTEPCWDCVHDDFRLCAESHGDESDVILESSDGGASDAEGDDDSSGGLGPEPDGSAAANDDGATADAVMAQDLDGDEGPEPDIVEDDN